MRGGLLERQEHVSRENYFKKEHLKQIIPNSVILAPDEDSLLKIECYLMENKQALPNPERDFFSLIKSYKTEKINDEAFCKVSKIFDEFRRVTLDPSSYLLRYSNESTLSLRYSHPGIKDAHLRLTAPFEFPKCTRKTETVVPVYLEEIQDYFPEIILARAPFNPEIPLKSFKEPLTLELLTTF